MAAALSSDALTGRLPPQAEGTRQFGARLSCVTGTDFARLGRGGSPTYLAGAWTEIGTADAGPRGARGTFVANRVKGLDHARFGPQSRGFGGDLRHHLQAARNSVRQRFLAKKHATATAAPGCEERMPARYAKSTISSNYPLFSNASHDLTNDQKSPDLNVMVGNRTSSGMSPRFQALESCRGSITYGV